ncbi:MAG: response regulator [Chitinophagaceae bacterium]|nr:response regulator [Chitinophagaceae bacterium]
MVLFVINKSKILTEKLVSMVNETGSVETIYTAGTYNVAIELLHRIQPDIVLLDMDLPGSKPVELLNEIKSLDSNVSFIVLFSQVNDIKKQYCKYAGVDFVFDKQHDLKKITPAISALTTNKK